LVDQRPVGRIIGHNTLLSGRAPTLPSLCAVPDHR
jgi:hypothetical protein